MTVTGAPTFNEPFPNEEAHYQHHRDLEELGGGPEVDPSAISSLATNIAAAQTGIASDANELVEWSSPGTVVGADIEVDGDDPTLINILTDGIYAVTAYIALSGALTASQIALVAPIPGGHNPWDEYDEAVVTARDYTISATGFLAAGDVITLTGYASTSASTWTIESASIVVQKLEAGTGAQGEQGEPGPPGAADGLASDYEIVLGKLEESAEDALPALFDPASTEWNSNGYVTWDWSGDGEITEAFSTGYDADLDTTHLAAVTRHVEGGAVPKARLELYSQLADESSESLIQILSDADAIDISGLITPGDGFFDLAVAPNATQITFQAQTGQDANTSLFSVLDSSSGDIFIIKPNNRIGFFGAGATAKPTGVAVTAEAIHAALSTLGLIGA